jgi:predicted DNA-binding transcriptional regulator AlpA
MSYTLGVANIFWRITLNQSIDELGELYSTVQVLKYLHISRWVLNKLVLTGEFPQAIKMSERVSKWRKRDLDAWIRKRSQL